MFPHQVLFPLSPFPLSTSLSGWFGLTCVFSSLTLSGPATFSEWHSSPKWWPLSPWHYLEPRELDALMLTAYGSTIIPTPFTNTLLSEWCSCWETVTQLSGRHFDLPRGACGHRYIDLLCNEVNLLIRDFFPSERIIIFSSVILQRDRWVRRLRDIKRVLERRMDLWSDNNIDLLIQEAVCCDRTFKRPLQSMNEEHTNKVFTRLMLQGKTRPAMHWLTSRAKSHVLSPDNVIIVDVDGVAQSMSIVNALKLKHPTSHPPHSSTLLNPSQLPLLEDVEVMDGHIGLTAHRIQGSAGPGGCDSTHCQDILLRFGPRSQRLRDSIADLTHHLANTLVTWESVWALLANRLITLDKSPGVHPIGVGETLRRIIGKAICLIAREDIESACGTNQLCASLKYGIEGAIHAADDLFDSNDYGLLVIDAKNAFNTINRSALLWNIRILWPRASRFIFYIEDGHPSSLRDLTSISIAWKV